MYLQMIPGKKSDFSLHTLHFVPAWFCKCLIITHFTTSRFCKAPKKIKKYFRNALRRCLAVGRGTLGTLGNPATPTGFAGPFMHDIASLYR